MKPHIGIFGRRNNGKSSIINAIANQEVAIVSETAGTTTDPVKKSFEIGGIGAVVLIDTAGIDDRGELGSKRINRSLEVLKIIDAGILVISNNEFGEFEKNIIEQFKEFEIPYFIVHNKSDEERIKEETIKKAEGADIIEFSAKEKSNLEELINLLRQKIPASAYRAKTLIGDLVSSGDTVLLITPIDNEAPEGRMILPQVQVIRDILDNDCIAVVLKENEINSYISKMQPKPKLVITDSQVFNKADAAVPKDIALTSFSIVLARQKGNFKEYLKGTSHISKLKDNDKVLILESCSHHVACDDIGREKIPKWLRGYTGKKLEFTVIPGLNKLPEDYKEFSMVIQCGGCMITHKQLANRLKPFIEAGIPVSNYGMAIAYMQGIYHRAIAAFMKNEIKHPE